MNIKQQILDANDRPSIAIAVPEWGGVAVHIGTMNGTERDAWEVLLAQQKAESVDNFRARLLVMCMYDDSGTRIFADNEAALLAGKSSVVLDRLYTAAAKLNAIGKQEVDALAGNFPATNGGSSTST